jgi:hypothetical protein
MERDPGQLESWSWKARICAGCATKGTHEALLDEVVRR